MTRPNKPWYRKARNAWCVTIDGKTHNLGPDEEAANKQFHKLMADRGEAVPLEQAGEYLNTLFHEFIAWASTNLAQRTYDGYFEMLDSFDQRWPAIRLADVQACHLDVWLAEHKTWGPTRRRNAATAILRALNWGATTKRGFVHPIPRYHKAKAVSRTAQVTDAEFSVILAHSDQQFADLLIVSFDTGARPQEIKGLEARHLELSQSRAVIPADEAKGKKCPRAIYFPTERALEIVKRLAAKYPSGPIFRNRDGQPWRKGAVADRFRRLRKHVGRQITQYEFRHGWITRALKSGIDSHTVAKAVGHRDTRMIDTVYSHVADDPAYMLEQLKKAK